MPLWRAYGVFTWIQRARAASGCICSPACCASDPRPQCSPLWLTPSPGSHRQRQFHHVRCGRRLVTVDPGRGRDGGAWQEEKGDAAFSHAVYHRGGGLLGFQTLAGHIEIVYYSLMVTGYWAFWGCWGYGAAPRSWRERQVGVSLAVMMCWAGGWGVVIPCRSTSWHRRASARRRPGCDRFRIGPGRLGRCSRACCRTFSAIPRTTAISTSRRATTVPVTQTRWAPLDTIDSGVKNYVEGGNYWGC